MAEQNLTYPVAVRDDDNIAETIFAGQTGAFSIPAGTTGQRPAEPVEGMIRYNETLGFFEVYRNSEWQVFGSDGGSSPARIITTGTTSAVLPSDYFIAWNSATAGAKTLTVGAPTWDQTIVVKDAKGDSSTGAITLTADGCTIDGAASLVIDTPYSAVTLKWDGTSNWMVF